MECSATSEGNLRLHSRASRIRLGRHRVRLPRVLSIQVEVEDGYDREGDRRTITANIRNPLLGTLMEYRGWFRYKYA
ncbi:DUF4166 domain-containing protein [Microbacterium sp. CH12i]|uniref:DUF4166 domain-containing protein n=1 Tax=Microbacterium sp. CH12i TaxID=1479651 RepID=UPI003FA5C602